MNDHHEITWEKKKDLKESGEAEVKAGFSRPKALHRANANSTNSSISA
jgi:hypothetical protein